MHGFRVWLGMGAVRCLMDRGCATAAVDADGSYDGLRALENGVGRPGNVVVKLAGYSQKSRIPNVLAAITILAVFRLREAAT